MNLEPVTPQAFAELLANLVLHMPGVAEAQYLPLLGVTVWEVSGRFVGLHGGPPHHPDTHFWNVE